MKNLKKLQTDGLLISKSYGLGKEMFWSLAKSPVVTELGYIPPKDAVHTLFYEHEKDCGDVFVSLALSGTLLEWQGQRRQKSGFRPDRMFRISDSVNYFERERGTQGRAVLMGKLKNYIAHYRKTGEQFNLIVSVDTEPEVERLASLFEECRLGDHYCAAIHNELVSDPLHAQVTTRFDTVSLSKYCSNHAPND